MKSVRFAASHSTKMVPRIPKGLKRDMFYSGEDIRGFKEIEKNRCQRIMGPSSRKFLIVCGHSLDSFSSRTCMKPNSKTCQRSHQQLSKDDMDVSEMPFHATNRRTLATRSTSCPEIGCNVVSSKTQIKKAKFDSDCRPTRRERSLPVGGTCRRSSKSKLKRTLLSSSTEGCKIARWRRAPYQ